MKKLTSNYEVWQGKRKLYWYDSQEHPNDPTLASTHPHHKHIPPDIKHNRIPAPHLSFEKPKVLASKSAVTIRKRLPKRK